MRGIRLLNNALFEVLDEVDPFASNLVEGDAAEGQEEEKKDDDVVEEPQSAFEEVEIPEWLKRQVDTDVKELDSLKGIRANYEWNVYTGTVKIFLSMYRQRFGLSAERARSYMLDPDQDLCFQLTFDRNYCGDVTNYQNTLTNVKPECPAVYGKVIGAKIRKRGDLKSSLF